MQLHVTPQARDYIQKNGGCVTARIIYTMTGG